MGETRPRLFEASWEVCNKVGGIHTVITSKLSQAQTEFGDGYFTVGPYLSNSHEAFDEVPAPPFISTLAAELANEGIAAHYGIWKPYGQPTLLLDYNGLFPRLNEYKDRYWDKFELNTLGSDYNDFDQPFAWGIAVGRLACLAAAQEKRELILHAHEWLTASAILEIKAESDDKLIRTVFTTHATVLGRCISSSGADLYGSLKKWIPEEEAVNRGVVSKHQLERLGATLATSFTAVSRLTAEEATALLGHKPDVVTENGLDLDLFPTFDELSHSRIHVRHSIEEFLAAYFFPSDPFDLNKTSLQFTMGRPETANKGYDLHLEALGVLNEQLKQEKSEHTVVSFFLVPIGCERLRPAAASQLNLYRRVQERLVHIAKRQTRLTYQELCAGQIPSLTLQSAEQAELMEDIHHMPLQVPPPASPYELRDENQDDILRLANQHGLHNRAEDRVKVLYFPLYLDGFDGIFDLPLYDLIAAFDLGVFASKYEPWGYTPMESLAVAVPAITSTLAGFGRSLSESNQTPPSGVFILDREKDEEDAISLLVRVFKTSLEESPREWTERRISAYQTVQLYSWQHLYQNYREAYNR